MDNYILPHAIFGVMAREDSEGKEHSRAFNERYTRSQKGRAWRALACGAVFCAIIVVLSGYVIVQPRRFPELKATHAHETHFSGEKANSSVGEQCGFGYRVPGSQASRECANYIMTRLSNCGFEARFQNFSYGGTHFSNVVGVKTGTSEGLVVLGAHYDTRPFAERDSDENRSKPIAGANDGASGVAVLLEIARVMSARQLGITIELVFFDGEDIGGNAEDMFYGSRYYANSLDEKKRMGMTAFILVDMVGDAKLQIYKEENSDANLNSLVWGVAKLQGADAFRAPYKYSILDDHIPLREKGVPVIDIIDFDYPYWHTTRDTPDKVSAESLEQVGTTVEATIYTIDEAME